MQPIEFLIYGKIIIDDIRLRNGEIMRGVLGGGGPQAAFGARLWHDSVGFLSRSGDDIEAEHVQTLRELAVDLNGWIRFADIPTARGNMLYDENEYQVYEDERGGKRLTKRESWFKLLAQRLPLPESYRQPRAIHLITEFHDEPMVKDALRLRQKGALLSLEPIIYYQTWHNRDQMLALIEQVDIVSPDWPTASGIANSDDPKEVLRYWSQLGPQMVTVRHGHHGSYAWDRAHDGFWHIPAVPVDVVDPTGAGNCYGAGACIGWAISNEARVAATYGAISAQFLVGRVGLPQMTPDLRTQAEQLLTQNLPRATML
ncbi:MAG: carbohydrate kinase family protein [Chloroflexi bacterium]|nr:carbohydrate kinase family protein [Chloroflexota bacterium]